MDYRRERLKWNGWGWEDHHFDLHGREQALWEFMQRELGLDSLLETPSVTLDEIALPDIRLTDAQRSTLVGLLDAERVRTDRYERIFHAVGKSYHDLVRLRSGQLPGAPDAVVYPSTAAELVTLVRFAADHSLALIPYGGGSSVVGGVEALPGDKAAVITVDMTGMSRVLGIDEDSLTATVQAGIYGPALEAKLQERGYTLGHYPQSFQFSTLGGWIAARGSGQQSARYGAAARFFVGARLITPQGELVTQPFPHSAAGPDLRQLIAGSEGTMGFIAEATVRLHPVPPARDYRGFLFGDFATGADVVRQIRQENVEVAMLRLSDAGETYFLGQFKSFGKPETWVQKATSAALELVGLGERPCLLLVGMEGTTAAVSASRISIARIAMGSGGIPLGAKPGKGWYATRFEMPYLRDALLERGVAVDTLETATPWSNINHLHRAVRESITTAIKRSADREMGEPMVLAHISHSYADGASLYFTFVFPMASRDPVGQWLSIKRAVTDTIVASGGTISHHHGVGRDHRRWMAAEKGALGVSVIRAVQRSLDPQGVMNPGKLLEEDTGADAP